MTDLVSIREASQIVKRPFNTVCTWIDTGKLAYTIVTVKYRKRKFVSREEVIALAARMESDPIGRRTRACLERGEPDEAEIEATVLEQSKTLPEWWDSERHRARDAADDKPDLSRIELLFIRSKKARK